MDEDKGFLMLPNSFFDTKYWRNESSKKMSKSSALLDLLRMFRYGEGEYVANVNGKRVLITQGEAVATNSYLSRRWNWSNRGDVHRFIKELTDDGIISKRVDNGVTILAINSATANATDSATHNATVNATGNTPNNQRVASVNATANATHSATVNATANATNKNIEYKEDRIKEYRNKNIYIDNGEKIQLGGINNLVTPVPAYVEKCRQDIISDETRIEGLLMSLRNANLIDDIYAAKSQIVNVKSCEFVLHVHSQQGIVGRSKLDLCNYFINWTRRQYENGGTNKNNSYETNRKANQYDEGKEDRMRFIAREVEEALSELGE